ncbi:solute carrier family 25 (mitochondrial phosphate transporter), member 23/24/25/41 [Angomonas deanei]|nr:solute carrier family 25 (mitochondrial phosphate transporter), member 23/24/25/41 [Angomonas deanei]|eukprot:EPY38363.1 solute carrier family 25 (mitochondrial phosphate transporter), member 23/24/25/41 [Angomonas deanei]
MSSLYDDCVEREQQRYNAALRRRIQEDKTSLDIRNREAVQREAMIGIHEDEDEDVPNSVKKAAWKKELEMESSIFTPPFNTLGRLSNVPRLLINCTIGAAAGVGSQSILYPLEVLKTRVCVSKNAEFTGGVWEIVKEGYRRGGILDFYKGFTPNLVGIVVYRGLEMGLYSSFQQSIMLYRMQIQGKTKKEAALNSAEVGVVGMGASAIAQTVSYPLNVVRTRLQTQGSKGRPKQYNGTIDCIVKMVKSKGVSSLFSGLLPNYMKAIPASAVTFMMFEKTQSLLLGDE